VPSEAPQDRDLPAEAPRRSDAPAEAAQGGTEPDDDLVPGFAPANELERILARSVLNGARATLLRALARSTLCVPAELSVAGLGEADAGGVRVPCVADTEGRHALVYTSYRQLALAHNLADDSPWFEVPVEALFAKWPADVDVWLNAGGELGFPLDPVDVGTVADIAAGLEVDEAYELGPDDEFTDFPGPSVPDDVDCAVVLALFDVPEVLEVSRIFRRLEEPRGRTWRILLVLVDQETGQRPLAETVANAVNESSDEACEVHVADVHDDEVYDAVAHLLAVGVPLWRRSGFLVPDTAAELGDLGDLDLGDLDLGGLDLGGLDRDGTDLGDSDRGDEGPDNQAR
jgi:SseB protein N-terminal domain